MKGLTALPAVCLLLMHNSLATATSATRRNKHQLLRNADVGIGEYSSPRQAQEEQADARPYHLWQPQAIKEKLEEWISYYPAFVHLTSSQEAFGLPTAGEEADCPYDEDVKGCKNYILTIQDFETHPVGSKSSSELPEILLSGEVHGNERVGPTAVMETASLLLQAADCESKPIKFGVGSSKHSFNDKNTDWKSQLQVAKQCRKTLKAMGIDDVHRKWLARLVTTRRIVIVPTANALGYFRNVREEYEIDPNRDFPYDVTDPKLCMQTVAGRTLNEVFREHMFQLSLTFHGGMEVVGYEWGAPTWLNNLSPDDTAEKTIAAAYSRYGGGFDRTAPYNYGTMNDLVYYVRGGMEDWAYAGSWDPDRVIVCQPKTYGGYDPEKSKYNNSTLRVFNMLVETSNRKVPTASSLGTSQDVLNKDTAGNGHISRNIRLSLMAADSVQPYVYMVAVDDLAISDDLVPRMDRTERNCASTKTVMVAGNKEDVLLQWTVGGAFTIDSTELWYAKWLDVPAEVLNCLDQPFREDIEKYFQKGTLIGPSSGLGFFSDEGASPEGSVEALGPVFQASINVTDYVTHEKIVVVASAQVDKSWTTQPENVGPAVPPQSHIVNVRTNPSWHHESAGKVIQGRLDWFSSPLTVIVGDYQDSVGTQPGQEVKVVEMSNRFGETTGSFAGGVTPSTGGDGSAGGFGIFHVIGIVAAITAAFCGLKRYKKRRPRRMPIAATDPDYQDDFDDEDQEYGMPHGYSDNEEKSEFNGVEMRSRPT